MSKPLWSTIKIQVPREFITISPKTGKVSIKPPLTKVAKSISKVNKAPAIQIVEGDKLAIIDDGKYEDYIPNNKKTKIKQVKQEEIVKPKPKRENKIISGSKTTFKLSEPIKTNNKEELIKGRLSENYKIDVEANETPLIDVDNILKYLTASGKQHFKTQQQRDNFEKIVNAIKAYDFYPTPIEYGNQIYKDVLEFYGNDNKIVILDIACGLLSLSMNFIKNGYKVLLNEFNPTFGSIIKPLENSKVSIAIDDFFDLKKDYYYNKNISVIVMNPPFSVPIDYKSYKLGYLLFLLKGLDILENQKKRDRKYLYIICPFTYFKISGNIAELNIPMQTYKKAVKLFDLVDYYDEDGATIYNIEFLGYVSGFKTIKNGKPHTMNQKFGLFKFMA